MKTTLIKSVLFASMMAASGSLFAADNGLIAIITPSHDNPFFKAGADGAAAKAKELVTAPWSPLTTTTSTNKTN